MASQPSRLGGHSKALSSTQSELESRPVHQSSYLPAPAASLHQPGLHAGAVAQLNGTARRRVTTRTT
jgi:hypothetical protein